MKLRLARGGTEARGGKLVQGNILSPGNKEGAARTGRCCRPLTSSRPRESPTGGLGDSFTDSDFIQCGGNALGAEKLRPRA